MGEDLGNHCRIFNSGDDFHCSATVRAVLCNDEKEKNVDEAIASFSEIKETLSTEQTLAEVSRCMSCGLCNTCDQCRLYCPLQEAITRSKTRP